MLLLTTSRKPGQLTRSVARTLADALGAAYLNRGKAGVDTVLAEADSAGANKVLFLWERNGNPSRLVGFDLQKARELQERENQTSMENPEEKENGENKLRRKKVQESKEKEADYNQEEKVEGARQKEVHTSAEPQTAWIKPEIAIRGVVYNRRPIRHKGACIKAEDLFGKRAASLLENLEGPNQIVLSRFGLKIFVDTDLVLELKFRE